ncbi:redox-regulated ATPase YchF [bacterium]|nr:redox-regulated ATPase YchF [bacterium]
MKIALIGLPQTGKKTVFSLLTGVPLADLQGRATEYHIGAVKVVDPRVDRLSTLYQPQKTKYAEIECTLAPAPPHERKPREQWLNKLKDMDALAHVVRAFDDPAVFHVSGSVDPLRDIEAMTFELTISDLALIEIRLERIAQDQKHKFEQDRADEAALLEKLTPHLESGRPLREYPWHAGEEKRIRSLQFLTLKGLVTVLNCGESSFPDPELVSAVRSKLGVDSETTQGQQVGALCAKVETEVAQVDDPVERAEFLAALGVEEPAINVLTRLLYQVLGYISFFTVGQDEVRAWTLCRGETALDAAHTVHTDLARGFIRAEVMRHEELLAAAGAATGAAASHQAEVKLKETGRMLLKGKDYVVADGDIVHIRHSG